MMLVVVGATVAVSVGLSVAVLLLVDKVVKLDEVIRRRPAGTRNATHEGHIANHE